MSDVNAAAATSASHPLALGRAPLRVLTAVWLLCAPLGIAFMVLDWETAGVVAFGAFIALAGVLAAAPAVLVLRYRFATSPEPLPRALRRSGIASGAATFVTAAFAWFLGRAVDESAIVVGAALLALAGLALAVTLALAKARPDAAEPVRVARTHVVAAVVFALATIVFVPKAGCACGGKEPAYRSTMKSDLRNLAADEARFRADSGRYSTDLAALGTHPSEHVGAPVIRLQGVAGWTATVTHDLLPNETCGIAVGVKNPVDASAPEEYPACAKTR